MRNPSLRSSSVLVCCFVAAAAPVLADTLELRGGSRIEGTYAGASTEEISFRTGTEVQAFRVEDVRSLTFGDRPPASTAPAATAGADIVELRNGTRIEGEFVGGSGSEVRIKVGKFIEAHPVGDVARLVFGEAPATSTTTTPSTAPPPPSSSGSASGGRKSKKASSSGGRFWVGGGIGLGFGDVTYVSIEPLLGYRVTPRVSTGIGLIYRYRDDDRFGQSVSTSDYGAAVFARYRFIPFAFLHGEYEHLSYELFRADGSKERDDFDSLFGGVGFSRSFGPRSAWFVLALYNFSYSSDDLRSPYDSPWVFRIGVSFGF